MMLQGERIVLRTLKESDKESLHENAKDIEISRYTRIPHPYTIEHALEFIEKTRKNIEERKGYELGIDLNGKIIGMMSIVDIDRENNVAEVGYWVGKKHWQKGYATEALKLLIDFARQNNFFKLYARVMGPNLASAKLLKKAGFKREGVLKQQVKKGEKRYDEIRYGLICMSGDGHPPDKRLP